MKLRLSGVAAAICVVGLSLGATPVLAAQKVNWNVSLWGKPRAWTQGLSLIHI